MRPVLTALAAGSLAFAPAAAALRPVREALAPVLPGPVSGHGRSGHVALTFDDGPDPVSTPHFLDLLARFQVRATFFLLAEHVGRNRGLVREMSAAGHELAVHGWDHTCVVAKVPGVLADELGRARDVVEAVGGQRVRWYRPPYGVATTESFLAARAVGLETALWSAWGRDWERRATPASISRTVRRQLRSGGSVLLHDTDRTAAPGSWARTLDATAALLEEWTTSHVEIGPLAEHFDEQIVRA